MFIPFWGEEYGFQSHSYIVSEFASSSHFWMIVRKLLGTSELWCLQNEEDDSLVQIRGECV